MSERTRMTDLLGARFDAYTMKARVYPYLFVLFPVFLAVLAWVPDAQRVLGGIVSLVVTCGGAYVLAELGRDGGRTREPALFDSWGGKPTTVMLRHSGASNPVLLERRHKQILGVTGLTLPTAAAEQADPGHADHLYDAAVAVLREKTRDRALFPLVFKENRSYGFRRNLWGLRGTGITLGFVALAACGTRAFLVPGPLTLTCAGMTAAELILLLFRVNASWVRLAANAYALALLASVETLVEGHAQP
jgi:hypothetical protein